MENKETFNYTYSAKEQEEIRKIRDKYTEKGEDKLETLRRLDRRANEKGTAVSLVVGIIGTLLLGLGMCCTMVFDTVWFIPGIMVGVIGIAVLSLAYPIYNSITKKECEKLAPEIIRLTDELLK